MIVRANSPYDPWWRTDSTTDSARWYNTIKTWYQYENCFGSAITVSIRNLFPVSGKRYSGYWRFYLLPCTYATTQTVGSGSLTHNKLCNLPGIIWKDTNPLTRQSFITLKGYAKPSTVHALAAKDPEKDFWNPVGTNPPSTIATYWIIIALPLKVNTWADDVETIKNSLYVSISMKMYMSFRARSRDFTEIVNDDDIAGTDTLGTGETDITVSGFVTDVPGTQGQS